MKSMTVIGAILIAIGALYILLWRGVFTEAYELAVVGVSQHPRDWPALKQEYPRLAIALRVTGHAEAIFKPTPEAPELIVHVMQDVYRCASFNTIGGAGVAIFGLGFICGAAGLRFRCRNAPSPSRTEP
jgi:hypothetical protein